MSRLAIPALGFRLALSSSCRAGSGSLRHVERRGRRRSVCVSGLALADDRAVPGRAGADGCGHRGRRAQFYFGAVDGGVWATGDAGRTWQPIFDWRARRLHRRHCARTVRARYDLCRHGRSGYALGHRAWQRSLQIDRCGQALELHRPRRQPPDRPHPRRSAQSQSRLCRGAGTRLWTQCRARACSARPTAARIGRKGAVQERRHGRDRSCVQARRCEHDLCRAVADAASALERLSAVERTGQRALCLA
jgi:hypothetical protein